MAKSSYLKLSFGLVLFIILILSLLFLAQWYLFHSYSLGSYSPKEMKCTTTLAPEIEGKIPHERNTKNFVIALTEKGVYRKLHSETQWYLLTCPPSIDLEYYFRSNPDTDNVVSFPGFGLYLSKDAGLTWIVLYDNIRFNAAFISKDNILYVAAKPLTNYFDAKEIHRYIRLLYYGIPHYDRDRILFSEDYGKTWKDITGDIPAGFRINGVYKDPHNNTSICLEGWSVRNYAFQVASSKFGNYKWTEIAFGDCRKPDTLVIP